MPDVFLLWPPASLPRGANRGILAALPKQPAVNKAMHITVISNIHSHNIHQFDTDNALAGRKRAPHHGALAMPLQAVFSIACSGIFCSSSIVPTTST